MPIDLADEKVSAERLKTPIDVEPPFTEQTELTSKSAAEEIARAISEAKNPVIFVDGLVMRHNAVNETRKLTELLGFPVFYSGIGAGIIDPTSHQMVGMYNGRCSSPGASEAFEASDLILIFGRLPSDTNTGGFSQIMPIGQSIEFKPDEVDVSLRV